MTRRLKLVSTILVLALGLGSASILIADRSRGAANEQQRAAPRQGPTVPVVTATATGGDFPLHRRTIGWAEPIAQVAVKARVDSQLMTQQFRDGDMVREGQTLFTLDDRELRAQLARDEANLARDRAVLTRTRADLARKRELVGRGAATQQMVDQAVSDEASAQATVAADEAQVELDRLRISYTTITAPISGRAGAATVTPGNLVRANDTAGLVTITQVSPIRVTFQLPQRDLAALQAALSAGTPPPVRVFASRSTTPLAAGTVTFLDSNVDQQSGTVTVKADFSNENAALWPGMYLDVEVTLGTVPNAVIVPTVSVQPGQTSSYVFVVKPDSTVELRPVEVAAAEGDQTAVTRGVAAGERIVIDGQTRLTPGMRTVERSAPSAPAGVEAAPPANARS